ncbi:hypothetical protein H5410_032485 [Solanum commersonii]|uniref:Cytochrome P450 n=1 Tax=Solanum commersonii TaxID=4109 RepID=A0A9J5YK29_SOLCO|nr:hypothetical protein H5410_032485 [Solanum commersonii]
MRKICTLELFSIKMIKLFSAIREDELMSLISSIRSMRGSLVNMTKKIFLFTNCIICRSAFGKVCKERGEFLTILKEVLLLGAGFSVGDLFPTWKLLHNLRGEKTRMVTAHKKVDAVMEEILNEHIENKAAGKKENGEFGDEDLVDVFLRVKENSQLQFPIANENIKAVIFDIFLAGSETSFTVIIWAFTEMMKNPHIMAKAQSEVRRVFKGKKIYDEEGVENLTYLNLVIKETLRLHAPVPLLAPKECREEIVIDGYTIAINTRVLVNAWAIGRDPESWHDPDNFIPERFENSSVDFIGNHFEFIPFGAGRRICPGMVFGLANVGLPLAQLLYHFDWKLPHGTKPNDLDMTETHGLSAARQKDLQWRNEKQNKLPPGPWKLPFIGSLHHLIGRGLPHRVLRNLSQRYGPIMYLQLGQVPTVVISSPTMAKQVLKTHDLAFANRPQLTSTSIIFYDKKDIAFSPYGDYWRQMRKICILELLSTKMVKSFGAIRQEELSSLISSLRSMSGATINMTEKIFLLSNCITCRTPFGKNAKIETSS